MRTYKGLEPCPGCGVAGTVEPRNQRNGLCYKCRKFLKIGREQVAAPEDFAKVELNPSGLYELWATEYKDGAKDGETQAIGQRPHYISDFGAYKQSDGTSKELAAALFDLVRSINVGERPVSLGVRMLESHYSNVQFVPIYFAKALFLFYGVLVKYSRACYQDGFNEGRNLLTGLASGSMTIDAVNEQVIRVNKQ